MVWRYLGDSKVKGCSWDLGKGFTETDNRSRSDPGLYFTDVFSGPSTLNTQQSKMAEIATWLLCVLSFQSMQRGAEGCIILLVTLLKQATTLCIYGSMTTLPFRNTDVGHEAFGGCLSFLPCCCDKIA